MRSLRQAGKFDRGRLWSRDSLAASRLSERVAVGSEQSEHSVLSGSFNSRQRGRIVSRRPASVTQAEVARTLRAAKQAGASEVEVRISGKASILIRFASSTGAQRPLEVIEEIIL